MDLGNKREVEAVFHSDSLRDPSDWPGVIVEMPIPVPLGRFSLVGGFSGLLTSPSACHSWVGVQQQTQVPKPAEVRQHLAAAVKGAIHEGVTARADHTALKNRKVGGLETKAAHTQEERRWRWMTWDNTNEWLGFWKVFLLEYHFAIDAPDPATGSELTFNKGARGRMHLFPLVPTATGRALVRVRIHHQLIYLTHGADETHRKFSNEGDKGGSRSNSVSDPNYPNRRRRVVKGTRHTTEMQPRHGPFVDGGRAGGQRRLRVRRAARLPPGLCGDGQRQHGPVHVRALAGHVHLPDFPRHVAHVFVQLVWRHCVRAGWPQD